MFLNVRITPFRILRQHAAWALLALGGVSCNAPLAPDARLSMGLDPTTVSVPLGSERSAVVTLTRLGDFNGEVTFSVEGTPPGVTATVTSVSTLGPTTTATVLLRADAGAKIGTFPMTVRGHANLLVDATSLLVLNITEPAAYVLALSKPALTVTRGGIILLNATLVRTNFTAPVTLSLEGQQGITADFGPNPAATDNIPITLSVAATVAPGTYTMGVRGIAAGLTDRVAPIAVTVIADAIQLIPLSNVSGFQGSAGTANIIVNRGGYSGPIVLTAEGLPAGVTASFQPVSGSTSTTTAALDIGPTVAPGVYTVTVRATGTGVPDATAQITLTVTPTVLALSLTPPGVSLLQGTTATTTLTITRTAINRAVVVSVEGAPSGLTITPVPANTAGTTSTISIAAAATLAAGQYDVTVRGTPEGLPISTSVTTTLSVTVRATATGVGNVLLDWSTCTAPSWVAAQDGTGSWTQVTGVSGVFSFTVSSGKGGYAFAEEGNSTTVRYLTQPELTGAPIDMCVTAFGPKTINGVATHGSGTGTVAEQWTYMLGGGSGASTGAGPSFAITGVRNGVHDFIAWGNTQTLGLRGLIRRDQDLPNGASLGTINLVGPESFQALQRSLNVTAIAANEQYAFTVSYLTTPSCTVNLLSSAGAISANFFMYGIPDAQQRSTDFHQVTVTTTSASGSRSASEVFHTMAARTVALPQALPLPSVVAQSGSYKRLQATIPSILAQFNGAVTLRYTDGAKSMSVSATIGYAGSTGVVLSMPDLSGVSGWPSSFAVPTDGRGTWRVTVDGLNANVPLCTENRRAISAWQTGTF